MYPKKGRKESQIAIVSRERDDYYYDYELGESASSSQESSTNNLALDYQRGTPNNQEYHRSSTSSSSDGSGKHLVKPLHRPRDNRRSSTTYGKERKESQHDLIPELESNENEKNSQSGHHLRVPTRKDNFFSTRAYEGKPSVTQSVAIGTRIIPDFQIGPPSSTPPSSPRSPSPLRLPASPLPTEMFGSPYDFKMKQAHPYNFHLHPERYLTPPVPGGKVGHFYNAYWHNDDKCQSWFLHSECQDENRRCSQCQLKEENSSTCSSVNPPPTFTAMDNYRPVLKKNRKCSCGAISVVTTAFSTLILVLIAAFILYTEMVLKKANYTPEPM